MAKVLGAFLGQLLSLPADSLMYFKGQCHEINNLFEGFKTQISTFYIGADGFIFFHLQCLKNAY